MGVKNHMMVRGTTANIMYQCITSLCLWHLFSCSRVFYFFYAEITMTRQGDLIDVLNTTDEHDNDEESSYRR
jgi:hypothetical protein